MKTPGNLVAVPRRAWTCSLLMSLAAVAATSGAAASAAADPASANTASPMPAVQPVGSTGSGAAAAAGGAAAWQKHQYSFVFMGFTSTYSCDGLADKLKKLLVTVGARADAKAQPGACASGFGRPDKFARADLTFYTLRNGAPADADAKPIDAVWRPVTLTDRSPYDLRLGDCELIEQFRNQILPLFTTRNVEDHTTCIPHQESGSDIALKFDSLVATPAPGAAPPRSAANSR